MNCDKSKNLDLNAEVNVPMLMLVNADYKFYIDCPLDNFPRTEAALNFYLLKMDI